MLTEVRCACMRVEIIKGCMGHFGIIIKPYPVSILYLTPPWPKPASNPSKESKKRGLRDALKLWLSGVTEYPGMEPSQWWLWVLGFRSIRINSRDTGTIAGNKRGGIGNGNDWVVGLVGCVPEMFRGRGGEGCQNVYLECCFLLFSLVWKSEANNNTTHIFIYQYQSWQEERFPT